MWGVLVVLLGGRRAEDTCSSRTTCCKWIRPLIPRTISTISSTSAIAEIDQKDWLVIQRRQLLRTGLHKLDQQAELIWENIDRAAEGNRCLRKPVR